jgi:cytochrome P450
MTPSSILMDPTIFTDPYEFRPERWLGPPAEQMHQEKFLVPFGRGARMCIGMK